MVVGGAVVGVLVSLLSAQVLQGLLYEVEAIDPGTFVSVVAVTLVVGLMAAAVPAIRAARVDPVEALRAE